MIMWSLPLTFLLLLFFLLKIYVFILEIYA